MLKKAIYLWLFLIIWAGPAHAVCSDEFMNMIGDVNWTGVYPIRMGGVNISPSFPEKESLIQEPICKCEDGAFQRIGITVGYREPARIIDVVKDQFCLNALGMELGDSEVWGGGGFRNAGGKAGENSYFAHAHLYYFPVWAILELFVDFVCQETGGLDVAYMTEFDPLWDDDLLANILSPESLLFSSPAAQMACIPDSISASAGYPMDSLFWCNGSWGGIYPIGGTSGDSDQIEAAASIASKLIFKMHRQLMMHGTKGKGALCGTFPEPVWNKSQYRMQIFKPASGEMLFSIGRSGLLWGANKASTNPEGADNFSYLVWRYRDCCAF